jgi:hypothetical protein
MTISSWINDYRWAMNVMRARRWRNNLPFSRRRVFDLSLRPMIGGPVIGYPDAFYHITIEDLCRAMRESLGE